MRETFKFCTYKKWGADCNRKHKDIEGVKEVA